MLFCRTDDSKKSFRKYVLKFLGSRILEFCSGLFSNFSRARLRRPNTVLKYTGVSKRYLETTFFWVPEIGVVQDQLKRNEFW